jgi:hypothetical protein
MLAVALAPAASAAQTPTPAEAQAGLDWLVGAWRGEGRRMGETLPARLNVRPVLGRHFFEFVYSSGTFEGRAIYRDAGGGSWRAWWFDSRGVTLPITATAAGRALTADWGDAATERGRTVYRLLDDGRLEITDSVRTTTDGVLRPFATHLLERAE